MASRRMFSRSVTIDNDDYMMLSNEAKLLYLHLGIMADDDGFLKSSIRAMNDIKVSKSVLEELINAGFLIRFDSNVILIRHWKQNNQIRNDRHHDTTYKKEMKQVYFDEESKTYELYSSSTISSPERLPNGNQMTTECYQDVTQMVDELLSDGKPRLDKTSVDKVSVGKISEDEFSPVQTSVGESENYDEIFKNYKF